MAEVSTKILRPGWQNTRQGYPKDFDGYHSDLPAKLHRSTYKTLGNYRTDNEMISESAFKQREALQRKVETKIHHSMVNFLSFPTTLGKTREEYLSKTGILLYPEDYGTTDYTTTMKADYKIQVSGEGTERSYSKVIPSLADMYKTTDKFRRLIVDGESPRRCGMNKFYDENMFHLDEKRKSVPLSQPPFALHYDPTTKEAVF